MKNIYVKAIYEADYGCEDRPAEKETMCLVVFETEEKEIRLEIKDSVLIKNDIEEKMWIDADTFETLKAGTL